MIQGLFFSTSEEHSAIYILLAHLGNDYVWTAHWINCRGFGSLCMHTVKKIHYIFFISNNLKIKIRYRVSSAVLVVGRECTVPSPLHRKAWLRHWPTLCKDTSVLGQLISNGQSRQEYQDLTILAQQGTSLRGGGFEGRLQSCLEIGVRWGGGWTLNTSQSSVLCQILLLPCSLHRCGWIPNKHPALQTPFQPLF